MENKKRICSMLLPVLQETRAGCDLIDIRYDDENETIELIFVAGYKKKVNVTADSGLAMIKDIVQQL